ncbi:exocyst complex component EXO70B1-like [Andrographis paniculata]|uniref:exocyst complex component EXO70B1-like n=1 Tax=Andrographis paniculata TaxID=175694 RepID=UPI0021E8A826|nr:exocyst complex component EXO70B1-like [Andrographis paniculata]
MGYHKAPCLPDHQSPPTIPHIHISSPIPAKTYQLIMEKNSPEKHDYDDTNPATLLHHSKDVDQFIDALRAIDDKSSGIVGVPDFIDLFSRDMESRVQIYVSGDAHRRFGKSPEEDSDFMASVGRMAKLTNALCEFNNVDSLLNQTTIALQRAAVMLEDEFRSLLEDSRNRDENNCNSDPPENTPTFYKFSSFNLKNNQPADHAADRCSINGDGDSGEYPAPPPESLSKLRDIASTMIAGGYEVECGRTYLLSRRNATRNYMVKLEYDVVLSMDDVAKMPWQTMDPEISRWINSVKVCSEVIFPAEKTLAESVFPDTPSLRRKLLTNHLRAVAIQLLDFADATALSKKSAEKLFKYLDMFETLRDQFLPSLSDESLISEVSAAADRVGESVIGIFRQLEDSIQNDASRTPVPGGAVHPLTRYVMNYLKYATEYKDTLELIFTKSQPPENFPESPTNSSSQQPESPNFHNSDGEVAVTLFSIQMAAVINRLDENLNQKSNLYKDPSLLYMFLMNNGRYILQKVKSSPEIRQVMGDNWCRRKSTVLRQYHKGYQRETWNRVVQCLGQEGLIVNGKVNKALVKERLKVFTAVLEEILRTQSGWVVSDEQLKSELRISVSAVVIPAYRSFVGRFKHHLDSGNGRGVSKYIKYQPDDVELLIEGLFAGNTASFSKRKL